jgi:hypothetical protein
VPTVLREGAYRFFFYSNEEGEPVHIHVQRDRALAKFWLGPVELADSIGFASTELARVLKLVRDHEKQFAEAWHDYFDPHP